MLFSYFSFSFPRNSVSYAGCSALHEVNPNFFNPLSAKPTKWSNTLKQFVRVKKADIL